MPKGTEVHVGFFCPQSKQTCKQDYISTLPKAEQKRDPGQVGRMRTLFAGFNFSFSKILSDCCLLASPLILAERYEYWSSDGSRQKLSSRCRDFALSSSR
jgi:hypothetical protein